MAATPRREDGTGGLSILMRVLFIGSYGQLVGLQVRMRLMGLLFIAPGLLPGIRGVNERGPLKRCFLGLRLQIASGSFQPMSMWSLERPTAWVVYWEAVEIFVDYGQLLCGDTFDFRLQVSSGMVLSLPVMIHVGLQLIQKGCSKLGLPG